MRLQVKQSLGAPLNKLGWDYIANAFLYSSKFELCRFGLHVGQGGGVGGEGGGHNYKSWSSLTKQCLEPVRLLLPSFVSLVLFTV